MSSKNKKRKYVPLPERKFLKTLKPSQRMQIKIRALDKPKWYSVLITACVFFSLFLVTANTKVDAVKSAESLKDSSSKLTLDFVGDVMLGRSVMEYAEAKGTDIIFENISTYWDESDLTFANLEGPALKKKLSKYKTPDARRESLYTNYTMIEGAMDAGIDVWACANDHMMDYGKNPVTEMKEWFRKENVLYSGILEAQDDPLSTICLIEKNGVKIAFLSITDVIGASRRSILSTRTSYNQLIYEASNTADLTIVYIHWGAEESIRVTEEQEILGRQLIDAGADIVIGSHPQVVQNIELYKDGIIFYSLGNFVYDETNTYTKNSVMVRYYLAENGEAYFKMIPIRIEDASPYVTDNIYHTSAINSNLTEKLDEGQYTYDESGYLKIVAPTITFKEYEEVVE